MSADAPLVPTDRTRVLNPLAAAVSDGGTEPMTSIGIAPYARPTPALMMIAAIMSPQTVPRRSNDTP